jgi:hypothetical protein
MGGGAGLFCYFVVDGRVVRVMHRHGVSSSLPLALVLMWSVVIYAVDVAPTRGVVKDESGNLRCNQSI